MDDQGQQVTTEGSPPAAPAPEGTPAAAPGAPAAPQGTEGAIAAARERLEQGQGIVPEEPASTVEPGAEGEEGAAQPTGEPEGQPPAAEGEEPTGEEEPPKGEEPAPEFLVTLQGIPERGEPETIEIEAPDQESFQILNRLQNEAKVGREIKTHQRALQRQRQELTDVEDMVTIDPTGFILDRVPESVRTDIAMQLFFEPQVLDAIQEQLREAGAENGLADVLENPESLRTLRAELKTKRLELRDQLRAQTEQRKAMQATAERVAGEIDRMIPESVTGERRELLFRDAVRDVKERCERLDLRQIDPEDVQLLVSARLRQQGITPAVGGNGGAQGAAAPARAAARPAGRTAEQFQQARETRRAAAATAPAGAGAPAAKPRPDLPKSTEERIKLARKIGLRALLGRS